MSLNKVAVVGGVLAVLFGVNFVLTNDAPAITFRSGQNYPVDPPPYNELTAQEVADYRRDGFLLKRSLLSAQELDDSIKAGERLFQSRMLGDWLLSFYAKLRVQTWRYVPEFAQLAFESTFPSISAQLLNEQKSLRILKDGFFGQVSTNEGCGFHVDDSFFWPARDDSTGVNFWIALSTTVASEGGGIRVVNQSLISSETFDECKAVIRGAGAAGYGATCDMEKLSPSCHQSMMDASVLYDMNPGDAILWDRWTFHRGEPFKNAAAAVQEGQHKMRYTIRYIPSTAVAQGVLHPSVTQGELFDSPFHPQVWPSHRKDEIDLIRVGMEEDASFGWKTIGRFLMHKIGLV